MLLMMVSSSCATSYARSLEPTLLFAGDLVRYKIDVWHEKLYLQNENAVDLCQRFYPNNENAFKVCAFNYDIAERYDYLVDLVKKYQAQ